MSWESMEINSNSKYVKIKGGETADIHILDEHPTKKIIHWINGEKSECAGKQCLNCSDGVEAQERWVTNVLDRRDSKVKLYEFGPGVARSIRDIAQMLDEEGQTIHSVDLRIKVDGSGKNTKYSVLSKAMSGSIPNNLELHKIV
jgi:hypothetical protein